ncbi:MAG: DUF1223 domain-containing protein [Kofleriaceae bacterium]
MLELFTSQGCSSCPPADRLLNKLAGADPTVAPLSFHVDYWDDLGWADPYASPAWTARQRDYAKALGDDRVYTPQLVIGGALGMVGSNAKAATAAIAKAPRPALLAATMTTTGDAVSISATAPPDADVFVAIWQPSTRTKVVRGENAGAVLRSDRVVRRLERVAAAGSTNTIRITVDRTWQPVGALAFAQRRDSRIVASAALAP